MGMVLLNLQKAFDTVDHDILLMKLELLGLSSDAIRWSRSYVSGRQQLVDVSGTFSSQANISCCVLQGSVLGPLLFLIYVNDMSAVVKQKLLLYADDAAVLVSGTNTEQVQSLLSGELEMVSEWLIGNKLSLHLGKTESILFGSKSRLSAQSDMTISCHTNVIGAKTQVKYLGAILDQTLSCESMALSIIQKANARLKFLYRKCRYLTFITNKLLVVSLIQCHFDNAFSFWFVGLSQSVKNRLQTTQNKLVCFKFR